MTKPNKASRDINRPAVEVWTDGACIPTNPGPGGWGALIRQNGWRREIAGHEDHTTNNRMELMGPIQALESLTGPHAVTVYSDSKYVVDGITKWIINWRRTGWKQGTVKNRDLWERLARAEAKHHVTWVWVKGHAGIPLNERADELANAAAVKQESYHSSFRETA